MAVFSNRDEIAKKALEYLSLGYTVKETLECFPLEKGIDEDKLFNLIKNVYDKARKAMTPEEWAKIVEKRESRKQEQKQEIYIKIANDVKELVEAMPGFRQKALTEAVIIVSRRSGQNANFVRDCTKRIYPDFYAYCREAADITPEYMEEMALSIIDKNMSKDAAQDIPYYGKIVEYLINNNPDLYNKMLETFDSHERYDNFMDSNPLGTYVKKENLSMLCEIILEYRVSVETICLFINRFSNLFLCDGITMTEELFSDLVYKYIKIPYDYALKFYMHEIINDSYKELREKRFAEFVIEFEKRKDDISQLENFVRGCTKIDLSEINRKTRTRSIPSDFYNLNQEDARRILKYGYKYALGRKDIALATGMVHVEKENIIPLLENSDNLEDEMLIKGVRLLNEFNYDYGYKTILGKRG